jgi:hypothetical protein
LDTPPYTPPGGDCGSGSEGSIQKCPHKSGDIHESISTVTTITTNEEEDSGSGSGDRGCDNGGGRCGLKELLTQQKKRELEETERKKKPMQGTTPHEAEEALAIDVAADVGSYEPSEPEGYQTIAEELEEADVRQKAWEEHVRTPDPVIQYPDKSDGKKERDACEEDCPAEGSSTPEKTDDMPSADIDSENRRTTREKDTSDPGDEKEGHIFDQPVSYFSNLSGSQGLTAARLRKELGWDIEKAKMALELMRTMYNWQLKVFGEHKIYLPPSYSEASASSCP